MKRESHLMKFSQNKFIEQRPNTETFEHGGVQQESWLPLNQLMFVKTCSYCVQAADSLTCDPFPTPRVCTYPHTLKI